MSHSGGKCKGDCDDTSANSSVDASISFANIWADEALTKYHAGWAKSKTTSIPDALSSAHTAQDKSAIINGRTRGAATLQIFDERWDRAGGNSR